jgi:hypothetical protein
MSHIASQARVAARLVPPLPVIEVGILRTAMQHSLVPARALGRLGRGRRCICVLVACQRCDPD